MPSKTSSPQIWYNRFDALLLSVRTVFGEMPDSFAASTDFREKGYAQGIKDSESEIKDYLYEEQDAFSINEED